MEEKKIRIRDENQKHFQTQANYQDQKKKKRPKNNEVPNQWIVKEGWRQMESKPT